MADNIRDRLGEEAESLLTAQAVNEGRIPPQVPKGNEAPINKSSDDIKKSGTFEGEVYYAANRPKGNEALYVDDETYNFLNKLYSGFDQSSEQTLKAQKFLTDIGYYDGELDGFYGNKTKGAIKRYLMVKNDKDSVWQAMQDQGDLMETAMAGAGTTSPKNMLG